MSIGERANSFNAGYAMLEDYLDSGLFPASLNVTGPYKLIDAVASGQLEPETHMLTFEDGGIHAFPMRLVLCYNVIQSDNNVKPWLMTFCNACNTGMVFDPVIGDTMLHFRRRGAYDGMLLIWDAETNSYWQHISGECLYGPSAGKRMRLITATRHMTAAEVLSHDRDARLYFNPLTPDQEKLSAAMEKMRSNPERAGAGILSTVQIEDTRRPRFELGLGVWNNQHSRFLPLTEIASQDNVLVTEFGGRNLLIYHLPDAMSPVAVYIKGQNAVWNRDSLRLDNGDWIQDNQYHSADGSLRPMDTPMQLLMRWYGFATTFPGCEVMI